jgi:hypothetical protein
MPTPTPLLACSENALALVGGGNIHERDNCEDTLWQVLAPIVVGVLVDHSSLIN